MLLGDLPAAINAFADSLRAAITDGDEWGAMAARVGLGEVCMQFGDLASAHAAYAAALSLAEHRLGFDEANTRW